MVPPVSPHGQERRTPATEEVPDKLGRLSRELQQTASAVDARIAGFEACLDQATAEFEKGALTRLQHSFGEAIKQGQERMKRYAEACGESRLVDLEAELERRLEPFLKRTQAARNELVRLLETLRQEQATWEARMAEWRQYEQGLQGWLAEETQRIHATAHDAVVEATGQVKGRMDTLADGTREVLERRMQDAEARLQTLVVRKADDLSRRLLAVEEETGSSFRARLEAQQAEVLDLFRRQARAAMGQAVAQMSETLNAAFGSVPRAPQDHLPDHTAQPPDHAGAGMDGNG